MRDEYTDYALEEAIEAELWNPWEDDECVSDFRRQVIIPMLSQEWVLEEIEHGGRIMAETWERFEKWAHNWLVEKKYELRYGDE